MKRICGWCLRELGEVDTKAESRQKVTTGVCPDCAGFFRKNRPDRSMMDFLNELPVPVVVVDGDARIEFVNHPACALLDRPLEECQGHLSGNAFQCAYARMPGGCGRTEHCKGCAIRRAIEKTHETGEPQCSVSASLTRITSQGEHEMRFKISTEKCDDVVLLRIEEIAG